MLLGVENKVGMGFDQTSATTTEILSAKPAPTRNPSLCLNFPLWVLVEIALDSIT
jgi:hypothetical protein